MAFFRVKLGTLSPVESFEEELRERGLPLTVFPQHRLRGIPTRTGPMLLTLGTIFLVGALIARRMTNLIGTLSTQAITTEDVELAYVYDEEVWAEMLALLGIAFIVLLLSPILLWLLTALASKTSLVVRFMLTGLGFIFLVFAAPIAAPKDDHLGAFVIGFLAVILVLAASYWGVGVLVGWTLRRSLQEFSTMGAMVARALPLLMLVLLFGFFNAEIWQIARALSWGGTLATMAVFAVLILGLNLVTTRDAIEDSEVRHMMRTSPYPFRRIERGNVFSVPMAVVGIQSVLFGMLVFFFLIVFGMIAIPMDTAKQWINAQPQLLIAGQGTNFPLTVPLIKVSAILAMFASLNFVASTSSDSAHRRIFMGGVLDELHEGIRLREDYLHVLEKEQSRTLACKNQKMEQGDETSEPLET